MTWKAITWHNVPEQGRQNANTFQVMLSPPRSIYFFYRKLEIEGGPSVVGVTPGNGAADLGAADLSLLQSQNGRTIYESFGGVPDINSAPILGRLIALTPPDRGTNFELRIDGSYSPSALGLLFIGRRGGFPFGRTLGSWLPDNCHMRVQLGASFNGAVPVNQTFSVPVPNDFALRNTDWGMQGVIVDPAIQSNALNLDLTNGLAVRIGG